MKKIKIGKNMKEVRIMRGLTQENLGEKVHLSTNYIGLIERNVDTPSLSAIIDIANELGVSLDYLVGTHIKKKKNYQECRKYENQIIEKVKCLNKMQLLYVLDTIELSVPGTHNVLNALACIALCDFYGISKDSIKSALSKFTGAHRRFEFKGIVNGARVFDDYGHHPTEIVATANSLKNKKYNESWVVFQPHTYSRTKNLLDDFANALTNFDHVIVLDIYAARESNVFNISSQDLVDKINLLGKHALYISDFENCVSYVKENVKENDIILTLGAGTVTEIGPMLLEI